MPANGYITGDDFRHGNSVAFRCHKDFFLKGDKTISCQNGIWSADRPSCEGNELFDQSSFMLMIGFLFILFR